MGSGRACFDGPFWAELAGKGRGTPRPQGEGPIMVEVAYAGTLSPKEAWDMLAADPDARLIDVRTTAEWAYVGVPDISDLDKTPLFIPWITFPAQQPNPDFVQQVAAAPGVTQKTPLLFICRSGVRSAYAAAALSAMGYRKCYNVAEGFEGDHDDHDHRGTIGGWKVAGLPWKQK